MMMIVVNEGNPMNPIYGDFSDGSLLGLPR